MRNYKFETRRDGNVTWDIKGAEDWREHIKAQLEGIVDPSELTYISMIKTSTQTSEKKPTRPFCRPFC